MASLFLIASVVLSGVLSPANPGVLENVQERRVGYGWGLEEVAEPSVILVAVDN